MLFRSTLFKWVLDEELIAADPTARVRKVVKETDRDRTLSDDEIRLFWDGCNKLGWPFGQMFKLLLLTAQRRDEVADAEWSEIDVDRRLWTIPREKAKNDRAHEVQLSALATEILHSLPTPGGRYVFTTSGERPVSGFSKSKERLDRNMLELLRAELAAAGKDPDQAAIDDWILHDLRRTAATGMARLSIAPHVQPARASTSSAHCKDAKRASGESSLDGASKRRNIESCKRPHAKAAWTSKRSGRRAHYAD